MIDRELSAEDAERLQACLADGGVAVFPTDTVYGLGCDPDSERAVRHLYELKGRPADSPAAVMFFSLEAALRALPELGPRERAALEALLPGPVTLLLPNRRSRFELAGGPARADRLAGASSAEAPVAGPPPKAPATDALGLRVPRLAERLAALRAVTRPLMQSSANLSGEPDARRLQDVPAALLSGADLVLDGGELPGVASTVVDLRAYELSGRWRVARDGPVGRGQLERALGPS